MEHFVITVYVDSPSREAIDKIMSAAAFAGKAGLDVDVKNWIVDEDETPELHPGSEAL